MSDRKEKLIEYCRQVQKIPRTAKWEDLSKKQQAIFNNKDFKKMLSILYLKKCWMCKTKFDRPLASRDGWNGKFLWHLKATHGIDPEMLMFIFQMKILGEKIL